LIDLTGLFGVKGSVENDLDRNAFLMGFEQGVGDDINLRCGITDIAVKLIKQDLDGGAGGENGLAQGGKEIIGFEEKNRRHKKDYGIKGLRD